MSQTMPVSTRPPATSRRRILVIDEEIGMRRVIARLLLRDYETVGVESPVHALERLDQGEYFDVILSDIIMPGMTGIAFFAAVKERHPLVIPRIVFMTGGSVSDATASFIATVPNPVLLKPFTAAELKGNIADVITGRAPG